MLGIHLNLSHLLNIYYIIIKVVVFFLNKDDGHMIKANMFE